MINEQGCESRRPWFIVLCWYLPRGAEEHHDNSQESRPRSECQLVTYRMRVGLLSDVLTRFICRYFRQFQTPFQISCWHNSLTLLLRSSVPVVGLTGNAKKCLKMSEITYRHTELVVYKDRDCLTIFLMLC
jgi:hypothetical protein